jgi:hypothetical protein
MLSSSACDRRNDPTRKVVSMFRPLLHPARFYILLPTSMRAAREPETH